MKTKTNGVFITPQKKLAKEARRLLLRKPTGKEKFKKRQKEITDGIFKQ